MSYYIYENWRAEKKVVIHTSKCSMCNNGKGIHVDASDSNGQWHGPFKTFKDAVSFAEGCQDRKIKFCKICTPEANK